MNYTPTTIVESPPREVPIKRGDMVRHTLSDRLFRCEDFKQERWMNLNKYYELAAVPPTKQERSQPHE